MKKFLVTVFASMMGFFLSLGIIFFMFFIMMVSTIASSSSKPDLKDNSILHICLNGIVTEQAQDNPLQEILGDQVSNVAVNKTLEAIKKAKNIDDEHKDIYCSVSVSASHTRRSTTNRG